MKFTFEMHDEDGNRTQIQKFEADTTTDIMENVIYFLLGMSFYPDQIRVAMKDAVDSDLLEKPAPKPVRIK
jgi:hypothetical protein